MVHIVKVSDLYLFIISWKYIFLMKENDFYSKLGDQLMVLKMTTLLILTHRRTCNKKQKMTNFWFFSGSAGLQIIEKDLRLDIKTQNTVVYMRQA